MKNLILSLKIQKKVIWDYRNISCTSYDIVESSVGPAKCLVSLDESSSPVNKEANSELIENLSKWHIMKRRGRARKVQRFNFSEFCSVQGRRGIKKVGNSRLVARRRKSTGKRVNTANVKLHGGML